MEAGGTPEKVAENDHLMKCKVLYPSTLILLTLLLGVMRVILTARQTLIPLHQQILARLVAILGVISKNPSNPNFDQYIFESISGLTRYEHRKLCSECKSMIPLIRFVVEGSPATLSTFEQTLFGPFTVIIQQDIDRE